MDNTSSEYQYSTSDGDGNNGKAIKDQNTISFSSNSPASSRQVSSPKTPQNNYPEGSTMEMDQIDQGQDDLMLELLPNAKRRKRSRYTAHSPSIQSHTHSNIVPNVDLLNRYPRHIPISQDGNLNESRNFDLSVDTNDEDAEDFDEDTHTHEDNGDMSDTDSVASQVSSTRNSLSNMVMSQHGDFQTHASALGEKEAKRLESNSAKKVKERARRGKMSESVKALRSLVPGSHDEKKVNQAQVMANTVAYITKIQLQLKSLQNENEKLKNQIETMQMANKFTPQNSSAWPKKGFSMATSSNSTTSDEVQLSRRTSLRQKALKQTSSVTPVPAQERPKRSLFPSTGLTATSSIVALPKPELAAFGPEKSIPDIEVAFGTEKESNTLSLLSNIKVKEELRNQETNNSSLSWSDQIQISRSKPIEDDHGMNYPVTSQPSQIECVQPHLEVGQTAAIDLIMENQPEEWNNPPYQMDWDIEEVGPNWPIYRNTHHEPDISSHPTAIASSIQYELEATSADRNLMLPETGSSWSSFMQPVSSEPGSSWFLNPIDVAGKLRHPLPSSEFKIDEDHHHHQIHDSPPNFELDTHFGHPQANQIGQLDPTKPRKLCDCGKDAIFT